MAVLRVLRLFKFKIQCTWWLAVLLLLALCGQEIERSVGFGVAAAELEGFGDELEEDEEQEQLVIPPPTRIPGSQTDRGPPGTEGNGLADSGAASTIQSVDWDEDEFEGIEHVVQQSQAGQSGATARKPKAKRKPNFFEQYSQQKSIGPKNNYLEYGAVFLLVWYAVVYLLGKSENLKIARAWAENFGTEDSVFGRNFSFRGMSNQQTDDQPLLQKDGQSVYKFYASGRRFCEGLLATLNLQSRQDLFSRIWYAAVQPRKDELLVEVYMTDEMDHIVFGVARKRLSKALFRNSKDLQTYATTLDLTTRLAEDLVVIAESRELATELLTETILEQVFGKKAFEKYGEYFQSMVFSDETFDSPYRKTLKFTFTLPPADKMDELSRWISIIPYYIDLVGRHKLSQQARVKAAERRAKAREEEEREKIAKQQELLARKKQLKKEEEEAYAATLSKEAQARLEAKNRKRELKKNKPKVKMTFSK